MTTTSPRKIAVVTSSRADFGHQYWMLKAIAEDPQLTLQLVASGSHFSTRFGRTHREIESSGFVIHERVEFSVDQDDTPLGVSRAMGAAISGFAAAFDRLQPDLVTVYGDRYEMLAAAIAATILGIPIAHIGGGETTLGAFDDAFRHAMTKMSLFHFTVAAPYRDRVIQMGEYSNRVFCTGAPGLDHLMRTQFLSKEVLEEKLGLKFGAPLFLVTYHPVTREKNSSFGHMQALLCALDEFPEATIIFTGTNADPDGFVIASLIEAYVQKHPNRTRFVASLGSLNYLSLLRHVDAVIGNSSSGILEVPSFKKATVNIGDRQRGRLMADSVVNCGEVSKEIAAAIRKALSLEFQQRLPSVQNPCSGKDASITIKDILKKVSLDEKNMKKEFHHIKVPI